MSNSEYYNNDFTVRVFSPGAEAVGEADHTLSHPAVSRQRSRLQPGAARRHMPLTAAGAAGWRGALHGGGAGGGRRTAAVGTSRAVARSGGRARHRSRPGRVPLEPTL